MNPAILVKTRKGQEELAQRSGALSQKQRSMLILVDGKTPSSALGNKCAFFSNCSEQLQWLLEQGYVEPVVTTAPATNSTTTSTTSAPPASVRDALITLASSLLEDHAAAVVGRLQDTPENAQALQATLVRCHKLIRISIDEKKAELFLKQGTALLNAG